MPIAGKPLKKGVKVITLNRQQRTRRSRLAGGRARLIVEDRDLTQHVATLKPLDDHIAILGWHQNLNRSIQHNEELIARRTARKQLLAFSDGSPISNRQQKHGLVFAQRFKQRILRQAL